MMSNECWVMGRIPLVPLAPNEMRNWQECQREWENWEKKQFGVKVGLRPPAGDPPLPRKGEDSRGGGGLLTLMRSFSFCHLSASSSSSMILSCSCSFCRDSSVCRGGPGGRRHQGAGKRGMGPLREQTQQVHSSIQSFVQQTCIQTSRRPSTGPVAKNPKTLSPKTQISGAGHPSYDFTGLTLCKSLYPK